MPARRPILVVLGTGFAAFSLIKRINLEIFDVVVISPRNHFLFTPLLPSTTVGTIEFRSIIEPVRVARKGIRYIQAVCTDINSISREIICETAEDRKLFRLGYDQLVIAVGAVSNTFGVPGVEEHAIFLKDLSDARAIRQRIVSCLEQASTPGLPNDERKRLLQFVIVGGGPTGVEFAAELHDFLHKDIHKWYPDLTNEVGIFLLEARNQILNSFHVTLGIYAEKLFRRKGIEVLTNTTVKALEPGRVLLSDNSEIPSGLVIWSTGIGPTPFVEKLELPKDNASRLLTDNSFRLKGRSDIYAIGDAAVIQGQPYIATAQAAQQEGKYLAYALNRKAFGQSIRPFRYRHMGMLAYIGSQRALADLPGYKGHGFTAWIFWRSAYLTKLVSTKNKFLVMIDWIKALIFGRDISQF